MEVRRFYAPPDAIKDSAGVLDESETHHLRDVLRLSAGDEIQVFDGKGGEFRCKVVKIERLKTHFSVLEPSQPGSPESPLDLEIASVLLKGDKLDTVVQKAAELGVRRFLPLISTRCDVRPEGINKRIQRWRRIALEATKQCGRAYLMEIAGLQKLEDLFKSPPAGNEMRVMFSERAGKEFNRIKSAAKISAIFGPEGGWDDRELELALSHRINVITLGGRIMKADTAAIAISAILQNRFGDLN